MKFFIFILFLFNFVLSKLLKISKNIFLFQCLPNGYSCKRNASFFNVGNKTCCHENKCVKTFEGKFCVKGKKTKHQTCIRGYWKECESNLICVGENNSKLGKCLPPFEFS